MTQLPLDGIRVVEMSTSVAGPYAAEVLHGLGADVLKIERPGGDDARGWRPPALSEDVGAMFGVMNAGKTTATLDLRAQADRETALAQIDTADVVVTNLSDASLRRLGLELKELRRRNPRLITASLSAFGEVGPRGGDPGYDPLIQALSGLMSVTGEQHGSPIRVGTSIVDMGSGLWLALGVVTALLARESSGLGGEIRTSLLEVGLAWMPYQIAAYTATGQVPRAYGSGLAMLAPYEAFATVDGSLMVAIGTDAAWQRLCTALDCDDLGQRPEWRNNSGRVAQREQIVAELAAVLANDTTAHWEAKLRAASVPCAPVQDIAQTIADPQVHSLAQLKAIPGIPHAQMPHQPLRLNGVRPGPRGGVPTLAPHPLEKP